MSEATAASPPIRRDPRIRGIALAWRLVLVVIVCAWMFTSRVDIGTAWLFFLAGILALYRLPRMVRLIRARDALSAAPWILLAIGTIGAVLHQGWALEQARTRFESLASAVGKEPCRIDSLLPPVVRATASGDGTWHVIRGSLIDYPLLVRTDKARGYAALVLHVNIDEVQVQEVKIPDCSRQGKPSK